MKFKKIAGIVVLVTIICVVGILIWYNSGKKPVKNEKNKDIISIEIKEGMRNFKNS